MTARGISREKAGAPLCGVHVPGNALGDSRDPAHLSNPPLWNGPMSLNLASLNASEARNRVRGGAESGNIKQRWPIKGQRRARVDRGIAVGLT